MLLSVRVACRPLRTSLAAAARSEAAGPRNRGAAALARGLRAAAAARVAATAQAGVAPRGAAAVACSAAAGRRRSARGVAKSAAAQGGAPLSSSSRSSRAEFKAALRAGRPLFGLFINSASPLVAEQLAWIEGFDYMLVDIQHAPVDYATLAACITAINAAGKPALVRVEGPHDRGGMQQALDLGAAGLMVPTVNTAADVERCVAAMYYPSEQHPTGNRSIAWPIRPQLGRPVPEYLSAANDEVALLVQCETKQCYDGLESVLSVPGVDCCFVGPVDLSHALGFAQSQGFPACFDSPDFKAALEHVVAVCRAKGVTPGNFAVTEQKAQEMLDLGFPLLATGTDVGLMGEAAARNAAVLHKLRGAGQA